MDPIEMAGVHQGKQLREIHRDAGLMTLRAAGARFGVSGENMRKLYQKSTIDTDTLVKYTHPINRTVDDVRYPPSVEVTVAWNMLIGSARIGLGDQIAEALEIIRSCPQSDRRLLVATMKTWLATISGG